MQQDIDILKQYALDNSLSIDQIRSATKSQVESILSLNAGSMADGYFENLRYLTAKLVAAAKDQADLQGLKDQAKTWLESKFLNVEFGISDRVVTIWLDGKPGSEEL